MSTPQKTAEESLDQLFRDLALLPCLDRLKLVSDAHGDTKNEFHVQAKAYDMMFIRLFRRCVAQAVTRSANKDQSVMFAQSTIAFAHTCKEIYDELDKLRAAKDVTFILYEDMIDKMHEQIETRVLKLIQSGQDAATAMKDLADTPIKPSDE